MRTVSSQELAERFNLNSAQVRKDLAYFGEFGVRGIGYYVAGLKAELQRILGLDREWAVALVGLGNLGLRALPLQGVQPAGLPHRGHHRRRPGQDRPRRGRRCRSCRRREMARELKARGIQVAIVAVPVEVRAGGHRPARGRRHQGRAQLRADPPAREPRGSAQERRPVDRARDAVLLSGQGRAVDTSPSLLLGDRRISYEDYGSGPVALLIHGSPGNGKAWSRVGERLSTRYRVIAPDLPGYGETTPQPMPPSPTPPTPRHCSRG